MSSPPITSLSSSIRLSRSCLRAELGTPFYSFLNSGDFDGGCDLKLDATSLNRESFINYSKQLSDDFLFLLSMTGFCYFSFGLSQAISFFLSTVVSFSLFYKLLNIYSNSSSCCFSFYFIAASFSFLRLLSYFFSSLFSSLSDGSSLLTFFLRLMLRLRSSKISLLSCNFTFDPRSGAF